jgi:hypothetical protein
LFGRRRLPDGQRPPLERDERMVAWASAAGGEVLVATNRGVWLPGTADRLGWHEIHKVTWSGRQLVVVAARQLAQDDGYAIVEDAEPTVHTLLDPDHVPEQVRVRVNRSIAYSAYHPLPGGGGARVVGRRVSGADGVRWTVRYDRAEDPDDPELRELTRHFVAQARGGLAGAAQ